MTRPPTEAASGRRFWRWMSETDVRQAGRIIGSHRSVTRRIDHEIVNAGVPAQRGLRVQVPTLVTESLMLSERMNGIVPMGGGSVTEPVNVPDKEVLTPPKIPIRPTEAWPPRTGVANT